ncbi:hypothetical protein D0Y65_028987 [Glycine soja]|uniref:Uncharacterized protein n=1 Tax=Glycine soja TaxID=3848 RepID=A0A445HX27_GLYSO|nr:hypothetical protein D0Y65_028987 [Glycine soja]
MEDLEAPRAFADVNNIREIINFVKSAPDKIPFAQLISNFSVVQERCRIIPSFDHMDYMDMDMDRLNHLLSALDAWIQIKSPILPGGQELRSENHRRRE